MHASRVRSAGAQASKVRAGELEFTIAIDRAVTIAPDGLGTEPCQDGDEAVLGTSFPLQCSGVPVAAFERFNTWRVPINCNADYPNLRLVE